MELNNMDRKNFFKKACSLGIGSCAGFSLLTKGDLFAEDDDKNKTKGTPVVPVDTRQVQNVLSYVETTMEEPVKKNIFERLGYEHTTDTGFKNWINGYKNNLKSFFEMVNSNKDTYWEKMEYDPEKPSITIIGKVVDKCACPFAQNQDAPKSLCHYCCKGFQENMFKMLLERPVKVRVDEGFLLGDKRCSTTIFFDGKLQM
jgi:hypothetical protein